MGPTPLLPVLLVLLLSAWLTSTATWGQTPVPVHAAPAPGNPVFPGRYADPEIHVFEHEFWVYPTYSADYEQETFMDAISSPDLVHWTRHAIVDTSIIRWARTALWAPSICLHHGRYYFVFAANDLHHDGEPGGLGVAVADHPGGPFTDYLGKPLLNTFYHGAQPIDPYVFADDDGTHYLVYGGWGHCNIGKLKDDFTGFVPFPDGELFHEITPPGYKEGPVMFRRGGKVYLMWSQGSWVAPSYNVAYAVGGSPLGPFEPKGTLIVADPALATSAGHHSVLELPGSDRWLFVYHRRPAGETSRNARVLCIDWMTFNPDGTIQPVTMTREGVGALAVPDVR